MGIQERKEREKEQLKELIMSTAAELFRTKGYEKTSIRAIAKAIEYSPGTIYLYFKDKDELLYNISIRGFQLFFSYFTRVQDIEDPMQRLHALGEAYLTFAFDHPAYYDLMFIMNDPMRSLDKEEWSEGRRSHDVLTDVIRDCKEAGYFEGYEVEELSVMIWGQVHGIVSIYIRDRMTMYEGKDPKELIFNALEIFNSIIKRT
ncbi:MAG: TetR family transcriptional regulator [Bacteroidetes bacterium]|jgi:AcrR family transcriptional regulator|nr:TetR family transcriptional regulator [Bacteroidota bacterium]